MLIERKGFNLNTVVDNFNLFYDDLGESNIPIIFFAWLSF